MGGDVVGGLGRDAVEHERQRGAPVARRLEQAPGDGVGVARGGGDEEPGVRGGEQLPGERAVGLHDGVDVGRVEQREPGRQVVGRHELQPARTGGAPGRADEAGEDAVVLEPADVGRVARQHGGAGGRPQHPGGAHLGADQAVDERRLARPGGAAHDHQQRRVHLAQARQQIVADLPRQLFARVLAVLGRCGAERQPRRAERVLQPLERAGHGERVDFGRHPT